MADNTDEPPVAGPVAELRRRDRVRTRIRRTGLFAAGVVAALVAVWLYGALAPGPHQLTQGDVADTIAQALASETPAPAFSQLVYEAIAPSLVLVETTSPGGVTRSSGAKPAATSWRAPSPRRRSSR
jgi:hypothetical protein